MDTAPDAKLGTADTFESVDVFVAQGDTASLRRAMDEVCTDPKLGVSFTADLFEPTEDPEIHQKRLYALRSRMFESDLSPEQCYAMVQFARMQKRRDEENILRECAFTSTVEGHEQHAQHPNRKPMLLAFARTGDTSAKKEYEAIVAREEAAAKKPIAEGVSVFRNDVRGCCGDH